MARFVVDLGTVTLNPEQHAGIAHAIQSTVLAQLAQHKLDVSQNRIVGRVGGPWAGMIMEPGQGSLSTIEVAAEKFTQG